MEIFLIVLAMLSLFIIAAGAGIKHGPTLLTGVGLVFVFFGILLWAISLPHSLDSSRTVITDYLDLKGCPEIRFNVPVHITIEEYKREYFIDGYEKVTVKVPNGGA